MKKNKVLYLKPNQIKPDPNQPRQIKSDVKIKEMTKNIESNGIINPIEIDENHQIITGEMRWRAAKEAGLKEVPCTIVSISKEDLFFRQVSENIHNASMNEIDTARALEKLISCLPQTTGGGNKDKEGGISMLSHKLGKSRTFIKLHLELLGTSDKFLKAVEEEKISYSHIESINKVNDNKLRIKLENKVIKSDKSFPKMASRKMANALNSMPQEADKILSIPVDKRSSKEIESEIESIVPSPEKFVDDLFKSGEYILSSARKLQNQMAKIPLSDVKLKRNEVGSTLSRLQTEIELYLNGEVISKIINTNLT